MDTLRPLLLVVQRCRSGQAAQVSFGKCTILPGSKAMITPAGQVSCLVVKSRAKSVLAYRPAVLRTRQALQWIARSGPRSRTRSEARLARSMCSSASVRPAAARSAVMAGEALASGALAGVMPTAGVRPGGRAGRAGRLEAADHHHGGLRPSPPPPAPPPEPPAL